MKTTMTVAEVSEFVRENSSVGLMRFWQHVAGGDMHPTEVQRAIKQIEREEEQS